MQCAIYKGQRKADTYLYVEREDDFSRVPESLLDLLGELELVMSLRLDSDRRLAQVDVAEVRRLLEEQGFFLQMPPEQGVDELVRQALERERSS